MNIWQELGIEKTSDKSIIKKAYHELLRKTHPEDDQAGFMRLRDAYEKALEYAENREGNPFDDYEDMEPQNFTEENAQDINVYLESQAGPVSEDRKKFGDWCERVGALYDDYTARLDVDRWRRLLYEDIPYELHFYNQCRDYIKGAFFQSEDTYLPRQVRIVMDEFFCFSQTPLIRARSLKKNHYRYLNERIKQHSLIEFDKLIPCSSRAYEVDSFFRQYEVFIQEMQAVQEMQQNRENPFEVHSVKMTELMNAMRKNKVLYLPFECLSIALQFQAYSEKKLQNRINELKAQFGAAVEIELLQAEYAIYCGKTDMAENLLLKCCKNAPVNNYVALYQMAFCCKRVELYYEAYMLVKQLTWLDPQPFLNDLADDIYHEMEKRYTDKKAKGEEIPDLEYIHMCRMYLRSNREEDAVQILKQVKEPEKHLWEYEYAHCLCIFYEESRNMSSGVYERTEKEEKGYTIEVEPAVPVFRKLEDYPKEDFSGIEKLEWEELCARYLFEQKRYEECEDRCNALLEEYPRSYPILVLRTYNDYVKNCPGWGHSFKDYMDLDILIYALPKRTEIRLLASMLMKFHDKYVKSLKVLEPVRDKLPDHYRYFEILQHKEEDKAEFLKEMLQFLEESKERELGIPPLNKYRLLDLHNIFVEVASMDWSPLLQCSEFTSKLESLKESRYNHPEKYVDLYYLYSEVWNNKEAVSELKKKLETAVTPHQKEYIYRELFVAYCRLGDTKEAEKYIKLLPENKVLHAELGTAYYKKQEYEKAVKYFSMHRVRMTLSGYHDFAMSYVGLGQKDKAVEVMREGIRTNEITGDYRTDRNIYDDIFWIYYKEKQWDECLKVAEEMRKYSKNKVYKNEHYHFLLGEVFFWSGRDLKRAAECLTKALEEGLKEGYAYENLARAYNSLGDMDKGVKVIWEGIDKLGDSGDYRNSNNLYEGLHKLYKENEKWEEALHALQLMKERTASEKTRARYHDDVVDVYDKMINSFEKNEEYDEKIEKLILSVPKDIFPSLCGVIGYGYSHTVNNMQDEESRKAIMGKAEYYLKKSVDLDIANVYVFGVLSVLYKAENRMEESVSILWEGINKYKNEVDYDEYNLYKDLYDVYCEIKQWEDSIKAAELMNRYTKLESMKRKYPCMMAYSHMHAEEFELAYYYYAMVKEDSRYDRMNLDINTEMFISSYAIGASEVVESIVFEEKELSEEIREILYIMVLRSRYMEKGEIDRELALRIEQEYKRLISVNGMKGEYAFDLAEVYAALGDEQQAEYYKEQAVKCPEQEENDISESMETLEAWTAAYRNHFKTGLELYEKNYKDKEYEIGNSYIDYRYFKRQYEERRKEE